MPEIPEGYNIKELYRCLQCAICTGSCPVSSVIEGFNPREMVLKYVLYGEQEEVLENDLIWNCTMCQLCSERCPHEIDVSGLIIHIMNRAALRRNIPEALRKQVVRIKISGRALTETPRSSRVRRELGLKPLKEPDAGEIRRILSDCGIEDVIGNIELLDSE
jgi:heterodisulfide reductase subunit C